MLRANDGTRTGGEILIDQLVVHGVQHVFCVPGESYLAALDAFYDRPINLTVCRQEGGATMMAEAVGKVTGRPGRRVLHPRAGRHQRLARHPHRQAGLHAADRVRRPGRRARCASARRSRSSTTAPCSARWRNGRPRSTIRRASPRSCRAPSTPPATAGPVRWSSRCPRTCWSSASRCRMRRRSSRSRPGPAWPTWRSCRSCSGPRNRRSCWSAAAAGRKPPVRRSPASPSASPCRSRPRSAAPI